MPIRWDRPALLVLLLSLVARAIAAASVGPGFDEAYYHLFARNLSLCYFDHPPFVAVTAGLGWWVSGLWHPLALRLGALIAFTIAQLGFYQLGYDLYGRRAARIALLLPLATPFFAVGAGAFVLPDNALVAVWVWTLWVIHRLRENTIERWGGFAALGVLTGLGLLAKYHAILLPASFFVASLYDEELRRWWRDYRFYAAMALAILVFSPVLLWNSENGWISFAEQFGKGVSGSISIRFDLIGQAIGGQLGYLTPWVAVVLWIGGTRKRSLNVEDRWLISFFLLPVIGMTLIGLTRGILPHWTMPGYIAAIVLTSGWLATRSWSTRFLRISMIMNALLVLLVIFQAWYGFIPLNPKSDPTLDPVGWRDTILDLEERGVLGDDDVIFAHKWFTAAEIAWADRGRHPIVLIGDKPHMFAWWTPETDWQGSSGIVLTQARYNIDSMKLLVPRFARVKLLRTKTVHRGRTRLPMRAWRVEGLIRPQTPPYGPASGQR